MNKRMELAKGLLFTLGMEVYMLELFKKKSPITRPTGRTKTVRVFDTHPGEILRVRIE
jgi:hypothetical protein